ncbi:MAG TPA: TonB-dependent receptor, partial [Sphingobium sp.]|nr:TonB-dependent receptor [Sphingobium sp.]
DAANYHRTRIGTAAITDIELSYNFAPGLQLAAGANNLFDKRPPKTPFVPGTTTYVNGFQVWDGPLAYSPYGINGGYYYGRVTVDF